MGTWGAMRVCTHRGSVLFKATVITTATLATILHVYNSSRPRGCDSTKPRLEMHGPAWQRQSAAQPQLSSSRPETIWPPPWQTTISGCQHFALGQACSFPFMSARARPKINEASEEEQFLFVPDCAKRARSLPLSLPPKCFCISIYL